MPPCLRPEGEAGDEDESVAVVWRAPCGPEAGMRILLGRAASILEALHQVGLKPGGLKPGGAEP